MRRFQKLLPFLTLIVLFIALWIASPYFLTQTNLSSLVRQTAVINIMALGMTIIIISGGIDLSVGSILAMGGLVGTMAMEKGLPILVGIAIGLWRRLPMRTAERSVDHTASYRAVYRHVRNARHFPRIDAAHLGRTSGTQHSQCVLLSRRRQSPRRSFCPLDSDRHARSACISSWSTRVWDAMRSLLEAIPRLRSMRASPLRFIPCRFTRSADYLRGLRE